MGLRRRISEMFTIDISRFDPIWDFFTFRGLRSRFRVNTSKYWGGTPAYENTGVNYDKARQLYRNDGVENLGSGFCRPIVDLSVNLMGLPSATVEDEVVDDRLNACLHDYWADILQQMFRDAIRDSKVIVRIRQPSADDPLMTADEREHCQIECIAPERVMIFRNPQNQNIIDKATVRHEVLMVEDEGEITAGVLPNEKTHVIIEEITLDGYRYWDETEAEYLTEWAQANTWNFIPILEVWNEFDTALNGGQSDLEGCFPFVKAFHDVLGQSLQAHKYHSTPKVVFKLEEIGNFLKNNFPDVFDQDTGQIKAQSEISWTGKEAIFLQATEDLNFLEAKSVLGDSVTLLNFLFQCICVSSETPAWAFMHVSERASADAAQNAQTVPLTRKIQRKQKGFQKAVQDLLKMYQVIVGLSPRRAAISWDSVQPNDLVIDNTALQQLIMALEVAAQRGIVSDTTYREAIRGFLPMMKNPTEEAKDAEKNAPPALPPGPQAPPSKNGQGNSKNVPVVAGPQGRNE